MVNPLGRTIGVNLPIYPLKGNVVTVPLKVIYNVLSAMGSIVRVWGNLNVSGREYSGSFVYVSGVVAWSRDILSSR